MGYARFARAGVTVPTQRAGLRSTRLRELFQVTRCPGTDLLAVNSIGSPAKLRGTAAITYKPPFIHQWIARSMTSAGSRRPMIFNPEAPAVPAISILGIARNLDQA